MRQFEAYNIRTGDSIDDKAHAWKVVDPDGLCITVGKWEVVIPRHVIKEELGLVDEEWKEIANIEREIADGNFDLARQFRQQIIDTQKPPTVIELGPVVEEKCGVLCPGGEDGSFTRVGCELPKNHVSLLHRHAGDVYDEPYIEDPSRYFVWD